MSFLSLILIAVIIALVLDRILTNQMVLREPLWLQPEERNQDSRNKRFNESMDMLLRQPLTADDLWHLQDICPYDIAKEDTNKIISPCGRPKRLPDGLYVARIDIPPSRKGIIVYIARKEQNDT